MGQDINKKEIQIKGVISENRNNDTLFLTNGFLPSKYFEDSISYSKVSDETFKLNFNISYPHLYKINFASERGKVIARVGSFFIDETTSSIRIDSSECIQIEGKTFKEFTEKFIPFINGKMDSCSISTPESLSWDNPEFDKKLKEYTLENPDSYVALWMLISRVNEDGHTALFDSIAKSFTLKMKEGRLWKIFNEDFQNIRIKEGFGFPMLDLKNQELKDEKIKLPNAKYTLIDYWFSSCKPCLESFPKLKEIYEKYNSKGFEIQGISIDRTKNIPKWKDRILEYELNWKQYLDENGVEAQKDKIWRFPTTFLLNEKGEIIRKYISIEELELFLQENL